MLNDPPILKPIEENLAQDIQDKIFNFAIDYIWNEFDYSSPKKEYQVKDTLKKILCFSYNRLSRIKEVNYEDIARLVEGYYADNNYMPLLEKIGGSYTYNYNDKSRFDFTKKYSYNQHNLPNATSESGDVGQSFEKGPRLTETSPSSTPFNQGVELDSMDESDAWDAINAAQIDQSKSGSSDSIDGNAGNDTFNSATKMETGVYDLSDPENWR